MLSPANVDKASICNSIGQNLGYFTSYILFLTLHDPKTCNNYFRCVWAGCRQYRMIMTMIVPPTCVWRLYCCSSVPSNEPMMTLGSFMVLFGWAFIITTVGVWFFKKEIEVQHTYVKEQCLISNSVISHCRRQNG